MYFIDYDYYFMCCAFLEMTANFFDIAAPNAVYTIQKSTQSTENTSKYQNFTYLLAA